ncbi:MAG: hypothetical protein PHC50_05415 [Candidatus Cloacimonetes bacterium]|nr:hypothetical protein [Candidatus Cloacimonadota bacterium]
MKLCIGFIISVLEQVLPCLCGIITYILVNSCKINAEYGSQQSQPEGFQQMDMLLKTQTLSKRKRGDAHQAQQSKTYFKNKKERNNE